jgi:hypothetical protein
MCADVRSVVMMMMMTCVCGDSKDGLAMKIDKIVSLV